MAKPNQVLLMLCPGVEWTMNGDNYEDIVWHDGTAAITKKQFIDGFAKFDAWAAKQDADEAKAKSAAQAKLAALGLTVEDLTALGL
jgi:hypothetical protein